jgi:hypothetical protein
MTQVKGKHFSNLQVGLILLCLVVLAVLIYKVSQSSPTPTTTTTPVAEDSALGRKTPAAPTIYLNPQRQEYQKNNNFTVEVMENSGQAPVNAVSAVFSYPTDKVSFIGIDGTDSPFTVPALNDGGNGKVSVSRGVTGSLTGTQLVAKVTFRSNPKSDLADLSFITGTALVSSTSNKSLLNSLDSTAGGTYRFY